MIHQFVTATISGIVEMNETAMQILGGHPEAKPSPFGYGGMSILDARKVIRSS
jgi:hypothetical protein